MALVDLGDMMHSLQELHMEEGLHLRLSRVRRTRANRGMLRPFLTAQSMLPRSRSKSSPMLEISVGCSPGRYTKNYRGGPDTHLADFVFLTGSVLSVLSACHRRVCSCSRTHASPER